MSSISHTNRYRNSSIFPFPCCIIPMKHTLSMIMIVLLAGCSLPNTVVDTPVLPFISSAAASLSIIDIGRLPKATDTMIVVFVFARGGTVKEVNAVITASDGSSASYALLDNGASPDRKANDSCYTGNIPFHLTASAVGQYTIQIQASGDEGMTSNILALPVSIISSNNNPPVISQLIAPDSVFLPTGGSPNYMKISVAVADSDGLESITSVSVTSYRPDGSIVGTLPLFDDGSANVLSLFNMPSGDDIAGDGRYTLKIPVTTTLFPYYDFVFSAKDKMGAISNLLTKRIYIQ
jgi:hypothetical protein